MKEYFERLDRAAAILERAAQAHMTVRERLILKFLGGTAPPPPAVILPLPPTEGEEDRPDLQRDVVFATHEPVSFNREE